jgi:hypothetical protein
VNVLTTEMSRSDPDCNRVELSRRHVSPRSKLMIFPPSPGLEFCTRPDLEANVYSSESRKGHLSAAISGTLQAGAR